LRRGGVPLAKSEPPLTTAVRKEKRKEKKKKGEGKDLPFTREKRKTKKSGGPPDSQEPKGKKGNCESPLLRRKD